MAILILIGALAGLVMGAVGVGGGAIIIFCLAVLAKFPQKIAQGTTLFIVAAPVSLLAAMRYYKQGYVDLKAGLTIMATFLLFSFVGAHVGVHLPSHLLKILLGIMLLFMGTRLVFGGWAAMR
ncbi:MAG: TSUP family transporter [Candidatus Hydrogenedentota bacterium]